MMARMVAHTMYLLLVITMMPHLLPAEEYYEAQCMIDPSTGMQSQNVQGSVMFKQPMSGGEVTITLSLSGFDTTDANTLHGFHVHADNDVSSQCSGMGGHFNPGGVNHGAPNDAVRHVGDLGNIEEDADGNVSLTFKDSVISLFGGNSIIGHGIVVHEGEDDLGVNPNDQGSITTGNAGGRLGCCVIQLIKNPTVYTAECKVDKASGLTAENPEGTIIFSQEENNDTVTISVELTGFDITDADTLHGFHIHQTGDMGSLCMNMEGHFNPDGVNHGAPSDAIRHVGDLGNIEEKSTGAVSTVMTDNVISLYGNNSIIGRGLVIHERADDLGVNTNDQGSITTGNAGGRIGCCIVQLVNMPVSASPSQVAITTTNLLISITLLPLITHLLHH